MRDRIEDIIWDNCHDGGNGQRIHEAVEEIIAKLPDMIAPLVWGDSYGVWRAETPFGDYKVVRGMLTLPLPLNPVQMHADEDAAKAAANTHHRAATMAAFMAAFGGDL